MIITLDRSETALLFRPFNEMQWKQCVFFLLLLLFLRICRYVLKEEAER